MWKGGIFRFLSLDIVQFKPDNENINWTFKHAQMLAHNTWKWNVSLLVCMMLNNGSTHHHHSLKKDRLVERHHSQLCRVTEVGLTLSWTQWYINIDLFLFVYCLSSDLLLALLLQVEFDLQWLSRLQKGLSMLPVGHVVRHDAHSDGTNIDHNVGQKLESRKNATKIKWAHG